MKITKDYMLFAENIIMGERSKATIVNVFDTVYTQKLPSVQPTLQVLSSFQVTNVTTDTDVTFEFEILSPSGESITKTELTQNIKKSLRGGANLVVNANMMPLTEYGRYTFRVTCRGKIVAERQLDVVEGEPPVDAV